MKKDGGAIACVVSEMGMFQWYPTNVCACLLCMAIQGAAYLNQGQRSGPRNLDSTLQVWSPPSRGCNLRPTNVPASRQTHYSITQSRREPIEAEGPADEAGSGCAEGSASIRAVHDRSRWCQGRKRPENGGLDLERPSSLSLSVCTPPARGCRVHSVSE